jgi:hypothetical protein
MPTAPTPIKALDLWIYGSGYGETIILIWDDLDKAQKPIKKAAVVDCYGGTHADEHPALLRLKEYDCPSLAFVAATHPHLDHMRNFHLLLRRCQSKIERVIWWGGGDDSITAVYYQALADDARLKRREPGEAAQMAAFFLESARFLAGHYTPIPASVTLQTLMGGSLPQSLPMGELTVWPIGPWPGPKNGYVRSFCKQFRQRRGLTTTTPASVKSNRISLGLVLQYGEAQIVLGGDMETANWRWWKNWRKEQKDSNPSHALRPNVIKVSHHGSDTGTVPGMWVKNAGFFGSHRGVTNKAEMPLCIITPWRAGGRKLPDDSSTKQRIIAAGCRLVVTGTPADRDLLEQKNSYCDSFVHVRVTHDGTAEMLEHPLCEVHI